MKKNPFYNPNAASYLRVHIFPYAPVITRMGFHATGNQILDDTTNITEGYHSILKNNVYDNEKNLKVSRFVRKQAEYITGNFKVMIIAVKRLKKLNFKNLFKGICNKTEAALQTKVASSNSQSPGDGKFEQNRRFEQSQKKKNNAVRNIKQLFSKSNRTSTPKSGSSTVKQVPAKHFVSKEPQERAKQDLQNSTGKSKDLHGTESNKWSGSVIEDQKKSEHYVVASSDDDSEAINWNKTPVKATGKH